MRIYIEFPEIDKIFQMEISSINADYFTVRFLNDKDAAETNIGILDNDIRFDIKKLKIIK